MRCLIALVAACWSVCAFGEVVCGTDGYVRKKAVADASAELTKAISRTVGDAPSFSVCVGPTKAAKAAGLSADDLPALGYRVVVRNGCAYILSRTATGAVYGISDFAARILDYHFITFDGEDPFVRKPGLKLEDCEFTGAPAIYRRSVYTPDKSKTLTHLKSQWFMRTLLFKVGLDEADIEGAERISGQTKECHSQFDYLPPETYFKDHPEYYMLGKDGKRHGTRNLRSHPCFTHPDVEEIVVSNMLAFIRKDRAEHPEDPPRIYDFTQMDAAPEMCRCERCSTVAAKYDAKGGRNDGGDAGLQLEFVNRVARRVKAAYPDVRIRIFAYVSTEVAPAGGIVPEDNVIVWLCDLYSNSDHEVPLTHPANARRLEILKGWAKLTRNLEIWDYMLYGDCKDGVGTHGDFPEVNVDAIAADARLFRDLGVRRLFMEAEYRDQPFHELNLHAMGACYSDPDCDIEKVVSDSCRVYGAAAPKMREAIDLIRKLELSVSAAQTEKFRWHRRDLEWLTVPNLTRIRDLFAEATALADTPAAKARTAHALRSATHKLELVQKAEKGDAEYVFTAKALNCSAGCRRVDDRDASDGTAIEVLVRGKDGQVSRPKLPTRMGIYDWDTKKNQGFMFTPDSSAKGYAWYELGAADLPPAATLWLYESWGCSVDLRACYATADGLPESYNRFKVFVRAKVADGRFFVDKVRLVRQSVVETRTGDWFHPDAARETGTAIMDDPATGTVKPIARRNFVQVGTGKAATPEVAARVAAWNAAVGFSEPEVRYDVNFPKPQPMPCLTDPSVRKDLVSKFCAWKARKHPDEKVFLRLCCNDTGKWCDCEHCKALMTPDRGQTGFASDYWWTFVNALAEDVLADPLVSLDAFVYRNYQEFPRTVKPLKHPRLNVILCPHGRCYTHSLNDAKCPINGTYRDMFAQWAEYGMPINTFEYHNQTPGRCNYAFWERPWIEDVKWYAKNGISHGDGNFLGPWAGLRKQDNYYRNNAARARWQIAWLTAYFDAHPEANFDSVRDRLFAAYYRAAAKPMTEYRRLLEKSFLDTGICMRYGLGRNIFFVMASQPGVIARARELLTAAEKLAAGDEELRKRLAWDREYFHTNLELCSFETVEPERTLKLPATLDDFRLCKGAGDVPILREERYPKHTTARVSREGTKLVVDISGDEGGEFHVQYLTREMKGEYRNIAAHCGRNEIDVGTTGLVRFNVSRNEKGKSKPFGSASGYPWFIPDYWYFIQGEE